MLFPFRQKGQVSAPFELLVAAIIMGFVILVGMQALDQLRTEQCKEQVSKSLQDLKIGIERTVNLGTPQNLVFAPPQCFHVERGAGSTCTRSALTSGRGTVSGDETCLSDSSNEFLCSRLCGGTRNDCVLLDYFSQEHSDRVCVNINPTTYFVQPNSSSGSSCPPEDPDKYEVVDPKLGLPRGNYFILNQTSSGDVFSTICLYRSK